MILAITACSGFSETIPDKICCPAGCSAEFPSHLNGVFANQVANEGDIQKVQRALKLGVNINAHKKTANMFCEALTPLMAACRADKSEPEMVRFLINRGAEINLQNDKGLTALMICSNRGLADSVRILLDHGADTATRDFEGKTAAVMAAETNQLQVVRMLTGQESPKELVTPLLLGAVWDGEVGRTKQMIRQGADVNATNFFGQPPLMIASDHCYTEIASLLIEAGADVNFTYRSTSTNVLTAASEREAASAIVTLLKKAGAKPKIVENNP